MATKSIDFKEFQSLYETCSGARDLKEFCKDSGVNYDKFIEWQRKQLRNEKLGRSSIRMIDERMFNLLRDQLAMANAEKSRLYSQVQSLTEELVVLRQSMQAGMDGLYQIIASLEAKVTELQKTIASQDEYIHKLEVELSNARAALKSTNGKRFSPTTEQRNYLNNRNKDKRAEESAGFDGKQVDGTIV